MDNLNEAVVPLHRQAEFELRLLNNPSATVATERELEQLLRRIAAHPHAGNAVLQTARALRRTPDAISVRDVVRWSHSV